MTGSAWIDFLITLGIVCVVIIVVKEVLAYMGLTVPRIVWIIGGGIVAILLLLWLGRILPALLPGGG